MKRVWMLFLIVITLLSVTLSSLTGCAPMSDSVPDQNETDGQDAPDENVNENGSENKPTAPSDEEREENTPTEEEEPMKLTFGSYNIKHGADDLPLLSRIAGNITKYGMDVVGLQEVDQMTTRVGGVDTMKTLSEATGYPYYAFFKAISYKGGEYGVGILSNYPIVETERIELESLTYEQRVLGRACIDVNGERIQFFVTHLSYENKEIRTTQFAEVAEVLAGYDNYVLTGDFNTSDFSEYSVLPNVNAVNKASKHVVTFPGNSSSIDNIVYSNSAWSFEAPKTVTESYSDHYALYAKGTYLGIKEN
ncbi:MAG: endonuclease/exonuclease/phosphatase family protein [Clostridia bacterium]|nr:endonuclease/exonuclease/phosphatase family protein [Clostridia bacterium]